VSSSSNGTQQRIYDSIWRREIIMPEEHHDQHGFEYAWRELLRRAQTAGLWTSTTSSVFDRDMFSVVWKPVLSAIAYAFTHFGDDHILQRAIAGFRQCAELASRFEMPEVFDYTILSLATITGLAPTPVAVDSATFPDVKVEGGRSVVVSPLSIRFGTNQKAQLAAVVLFSIAISNGAAIRTGWVQIFELYQTLFVYSLLPASLLNMEDFLAGTSTIPMRPKAQAPARDERRTDGGLLSTLSSYLLAPYSGPGTEGIGRDVSDDDIENTLSTVDCIASCRVEDLHAKMACVLDCASILRRCN
jgi:brefeldin A-resistance guanine nucleotide exchange factor 1